jgi:predicted transglutaminase-like cysteine proteinase
MNGQRHRHPTLVRGLRCLAVGAFVVATLFGRALAAVPQDPPPPPLFGTSEMQSSNIKPFPKWTDMLSRHRAEEQRGDSPCAPTRFIRCSIADWLSFLDGERGKEPRAQLSDVNAFINLHPYVLDKINYWETPREFASHDGDCKDYAIAKYFSLRYLGWSEDGLRVVVVQDLNLRVAHAILAAYVGEEILILDNQARQVVRADSIRHYRPYYSINESHWWLHKSDDTLPRRPAAPAVSAEGSKDAASLAPRP